MLDRRHDLQLMQAQMPGMGGPGEDGGEDGDAEPSGKDIRGESRRLLRRLRPPVRDPKLYEYD